MTYIGNWAFVVCAGMKNVYSLSMTPPFCSTMMLSYESATLYVPYRVVDAYKAASGWKNFLNIEGFAPTVEVVYTLTEAGYGTLILPFDAELPEGLAAYTCTELDGSKLVLQEQTAIRANVPLVMQGTPGIYVFRGDDISMEDSYTEGLLTGVYAPATLTGSYVLQNQKGVTGFYPVNAGAPVTVPAYRCYLQCGTEYDCLSICFESATGIGRVEREGEAEPWYDLQGRQVENPRCGVYIHRNKKVILK